MSRDAVMWALRQHGPFTTLDGRAVEPHAIDQAVLLVLADYADRYQSCFPSVRHLRGRLRVSADRLSAALQMWSDCGLLSVVPRYAGNGRQVSNSYRLHIHKGKVLPARGNAASIARAKPVDKSVDKSVDNSIPPPEISTPHDRPARGQNLGGLDPIDPSIKEDRLRSEAREGQEQEDYKESPAAITQRAPEGAKTVGHGSESGSDERRSREYLVDNLRRVRKATKT